MGQDRRESIFGFFGEWVWGCVKRWRPAALALDSEQPEHRAAECAAIGKERGTIPRGNLVKERQRRAFRSGVGSTAIVCRECEHQRAMKRGDIGTARAGMPGDETHAVFRVGIMRQRRNGAGAVDLVHQRGKERGRKIEQQPAVDHAHALHQRHSLECAKVERGERAGVNAMRRAKADMRVPRGQAEASCIRRFPQGTSEHTNELCTDFAFIRRFHICKFIQVPTRCQ